MFFTNTISTAIVNVVIISIGKGNFCFPIVLLKSFEAIRINGLHQSIRFGQCHYDFLIV